MLPKDLINPAVPALSSLAFLISFLLQKRKKTICYQDLQSLPNLWVKREVSYSFIILLILTAGSVTLSCLQRVNSPCETEGSLSQNPLCFNSKDNCWAKINECCHFPCFMRLQRPFFSIDYFFALLFLMLTWCFVGVLKAVFFTIISFSTFEDTEGRDPVAVKWPKVLFFQGNYTYLFIFKLVLQL